MIDHDRIFKELLTTFFVEFIEFFYPEMLQYLDTSVLEFLDKEIFTDVTSGEKFEADIVVKTRFRDTPSFFLILVEPQAQVRDDPPFPERIFRYFALLHFKYRLPVYPIVLFSYDTAERVEPDSYRVAFPDFDVLQFNYRVIQLRRLNWRDYAGVVNPVASALLVKMGMAQAERPEVRLASLRTLPPLQLNPARQELILGFINTYLKLTTAEEARFQAELAQLAPTEQEKTMELMTMGMEKGIEKGMTMGIEKGMTMGMEKGVQQGQADLVILLLNRQLGTLDTPASDRIRALQVPQLADLAVALLDFNRMDDLYAWLDNHPSDEPPSSPESNGNV
ncbi:MAG: Rpn family recombination-promoting nuclease/putative transposase [Chloroflexaceae bacterium]